MRGMRGDGKSKRVDVCAGARKWTRKESAGGRSGQRGRVDERSGPRHDCVFWGKKTEEDVKG